MAEDRTSIAIIGGGASGTLCLANLANRKLPALDITVFDRSGRFVRGIAYGTDRPEHLLNVRASNMSGFPDDPAHFVRWLKEKHRDYGPDDFVPRVIYSAYLNGIFESALRSAQLAGQRVTLKIAQVTGIENGDPYTVLTDQGPFSADAVIVATGNATPAEPQGAKKLASADGYYNAPWQIDYKKITGDVAILGTGLSMIDAVMSLHREGFAGKITAISRHGLLPAVHAAPAACPAFIEDRLPASVRDLFMQTRRHVQQAAKDNIPWQAVTDSLRPFTNKIWDGWSETEKKKFRRLAPYWNIHRHRMAPQAAKIIEKMRDEGQLTIAKDAVTSIAKGLVVEGAHGAYHAAHVINCLGYSGVPRLTPCPDIDPSPYHDNAGNFYAIGPALTQRHLETVAIPEIRDQAARIAARILNGKAAKPLERHDRQAVL